MLPFADREAVEDVLRSMAAADPPLVRELERQPGQHDRRWVHLLGADEPEAAAPAQPVDREAVLAAGAAARDRKIMAEYDRLAGPYAAALSDELDDKPFDRWLLARLATGAGGGQGLDVGCGPGQVAGYLAEQGAVVTGLDLSPNMVAEARRRQPGISVEQGSFVVPPMPRGGDPRDPGWRLITAWYALVHLAQSELAPTVAALSRVLGRGGTLALATHVGNEVQRPGTLWGVTTELDFVLHDADAVVAAAEAAGLVDIEWYVRSPLPGEAPTQRLYLLGRRPG
jgi:SAM-dependent methyltransferase